MATGLQTVARVANGFHSLAFIGEHYSCVQSDGQFWPYTASIPVKLYYSQINHDTKMLMAMVFKRVPVSGWPI